VILTSFNLPGYFHRLVIVTSPSANAFEYGPRDFLREELQPPKSPPIGLRAQGGLTLGLPQISSFIIFINRSVYCMYYFYVW